MRLLSLYVENFGVLSGKEVRFDAGMTAFCEQNGAGKSTLAAFVRAMLYGLPTHRGNAKELGDRAHYYPFEGGKFGGNLTYEAEGKEYRIERFFDAKSATKDTLRLFLGGEEIAPPEREPGLELFGIDEETFTRTVFFTADAPELAATDGAREKLGCFVENTGETLSGREVLARLEDTMKRYRMARSKNTHIARAELAVKETEERVRSAEQVERALGEKYKRLSEADATLAALQAQKSRADGLLVVAEQWKTLDRICAQGEERRTALSALAEKYPSGIPTLDEVTQLETCNATLTELAGEARARDFGADKTAELSALGARFEGAAPAGERLTALDDEIAALQDARRERDALAAAGAVPLSAEFDKFAAGVPSDGELSGAQSALERSRELERQISARALSKEPEGAVRPLGYVLAAVLAALVLTAGIGLLFLKPVVGGVMLGVGLLALLADGFLYLKNQAVASRGGITDEGAVKLRLEAQELQYRVRRLLDRFGMGEAPDLGVALADLTREISDFYAEKKTRARNADRVQTLAEQIAEKETRIGAFFDGFGVAAETEMRRAELLRRDLDRWVTLQKEHADYLVRGEDAAQKRLAAEEETARILGAYGICFEGDPAVCIQILRRDIESTVRLQQELKSFELQEQAYQAQNDLTERPTETDTDVAALAERMQLLQEARARLLTEIGDDEHVTADLGEHRNALQLAREELERLAERYALLEKTHELLAEAQHRLDERYIAPIRARFLHYAAALEPTLGAQIELNAELQISLRHAGETYSDRHLSSGQRAVCALCFRLALLDNMYEGEAPFLVLDDPFVHLDATHFARTAELVRLLAAERQILYFCCHESRMM